jgi:imidazolonepropionase-like amidohydrolase
MRIGAVTLPLLLLLAVPGVSWGQVTALHFGRAWLGPGRVINDAVVVVKDNRIESVGSGRAAIPRGARVVDLRRFTAIPGLIDVHTHMTFYWDKKPGTRPIGQQRHVAVTVFLAQENTRKTLEAGVTTVRDLNAQADADVAMRDLIAMGALTGPRMFVSGAGLNANNSPSPGDARRLAEDRVKAGDDWVKVFASRGTYDNVSEEQTLSFDVIKAAVDAAHALGRRIAVHSYGASGARDAVRAGADSIEHAVDIDDDTLAEMAKRGIFYVPTIDHNRYYIDARDEFGFPETIKSTHEPFIARNVETTRRARAAGVPIAMGSDAVFTMFGQNTRELGWFVKAGMTSEEALTTATVNGARLLGLQDRLGQLVPGFLADVVAVDGDPAANISALFTGVRWVMKDGSVIVDKR